MKKVSGQEFLDGYKDEKIKDMENETCNFCNECCSMLTMLLPEEYEKLKKYLFKDKEGRKIFKAANKRFYKKSKELNGLYMICAFSNNNKKCDIYHIRPKICKDFHCSEKLRGNFDKSEYEVKDHKTIANFFMR